LWIRHDTRSNRRRRRSLASYLLLNRLRGIGFVNIPIRIIADTIIVIRIGIVSFNLRVRGGLIHIGIGVGVIWGTGTGIGIVIRIAISIGITAGTGIRIIRGTRIIWINGTVDCAVVGIGIYIRISVAGCWRIYIRIICSRYIVVRIGCGTGIRCGTGVYVGVIARIVIDVGVGIGVRGCRCRCVRINIGVGIGIGIRIGRCAASRCRVCVCIRVGIRIDVSIICGGIVSCV